MYEMKKIEADGRQDDKQLPSIGTSNSRKGVE